jgi:hypothetical protein
MTTIEPKCADCRFAEFVDYNSFKCLKNVAESEREDCSLFEGLEVEKEPASYILSGKINEIIDKDQDAAVALEKEKQQDSQFIRITNTEKSRAEELDNRIYTNAEIPLCSDVDLFRKIKVLPAHKLIKFRREVIRNGAHLLLMSNNESKCYVARNLSKLKICEQCVTKDQPMDIILMSHADFDIHFLDADAGKRKVDDKYKDDISSLIEYKENNTIIRVIDKIEKDNKIVSTFNMLALKGELRDVQIGRVDPGTKFYISESTKRKNGKKIVTTDDREAILISHPDAYKVISDPLWTVIFVLTVILTIIIAIFIIATVVSETGFLIFWGFGMLIIGYIIVILVGAPIYLIVNTIRKYL